MRLIDRLEAMEQTKAGKLVCGIIFSVMVAVPFLMIIAKL